MLKSDKSKYLLQDPRPIRAEAPYTFFVSSAAELAAIRSGDLVKLIIQHVPQGPKYDAERMWVRVTEVSGDEMRGTLDNGNTSPEHALRRGVAGVK
jgi:hypothetical protein